MGASYDMNPGFRIWIWPESGVVCVREVLCYSGNGVGITQS